VRELKEDPNHIGTTWACSISSDGKRLAAIGNGLRIWDLPKLANGLPGESNAPQFTQTNGASSVAFDPTGHRVAYLDVVSPPPAFTTGIGSLELTPGLLATVIATNSEINFVQALDFLPKSGGLAYVTRERTIKILEAKTWRLLRSIQTQPHLERNKSFIANLRASPDESKLAVLGVSGREVDLWDPATGKLLYTLPEEADAVWWLAWSPDSRRLAVSRASGEITIWDLKAVEAQLAELGLQP